MPHVVSTMNDQEANGEMVFKLLSVSSAQAAAPRLGKLAIRGRKTMETPNYVGITSRGAIPHITPDVLMRHTEIPGAYFGLEDFVEKSVKRASPALFSIDANGSTRLHAYTAMPSDFVTIMGPRRHPAVVAPMGNGASYVSIFTSTGFQNLDLARYCDAITTVQPDIVIPLADLTFGDSTPNAKRQLRMVERTEEWIDAFFKTLSPQEKLQPLGIHPFAPLLPVSYPMQWEYLNRLSEDHAQHLDGLAVYDIDILAELQQHSPLLPLARLSMDPPKSPHHILRQVGLGVDIFTIPFVNVMSDAGVALTFSFPAPQSSDKVLPLGINMWSEEHQVSLEPFVEHCTCYACTRHHRAYLQHLLNAKEMLGWNLLQIHNHHAITTFFDAIRAAISDGTFEAKAADFSRVYDPDLPLGTGERPRARGYHFKSEAGQPKRNPSTWSALQETGGQDPTLAGELAGRAVTGAAASTGLDTPVVPEDDASELDKKGFAKLEGDA
ncbi:tRNA-guanine(15) transglycosylase-like protein [Xylariales sp. PMI_506]|nr:tRNA-guanine(15) transglycosylase-like protein [Xylariales sp. PMI_506]